MRIKEQELVFVEFFDHSNGDEGILRTMLSGWIVENHVKYIKVNTWKVVDAEPETIEANMECYNILKSAIIRIKPLTIKKPN